MLIKTSAETMNQGLDYVGLSARQGRASLQTNKDRFISHYGSSPVVCARLWEDLQTTTIPAARVNEESERSFKYFLQALHFLTTYQREEQRVATFGSSVRADRQWTWYFVKKIAALKALKVSVHRSLLTGSSSGSISHWLFLGEDSLAARVE